MSAIDPAALRALVEKLLLYAEDDVRAMIRDVSVRRDQFVDENDLRLWSGLMEEAAAALTALLDEREKAERVFQAVVYAFEGKDAPPDLESHGFVKRGRRHHAAVEDACASVIAFLKAIEWTDHTSETEAANLVEQLREVAGWGAPAPPGESHD